MDSVCVVGLGYVGLPLACLCAEKGLEVCGLDINEETVAKVNEGQSPIKDEELEGQVSALNGKLNATTDPSCLASVDVVIVCVPTPVDDNNQPDFTPLKSACSAAAKNLKAGQLVVIESTIYPGVTKEIVKPVLEESGLKAGEDFFLAHCPERIDPGNKQWTIKNIPRVVGGLTSECTKRAASFYRSILEGEVAELSSVEAAEATKVVENSFRDVNIAFANEIARSFDALGIDAVEVIEAAASKPFGFMPHWPGCGVGGHCIPVDPYYLIEKARQHGFSHDFLALAREINNSMPEYFVAKFSAACEAADLNPKGARACMLGYSYKKDVADVRNTPAKLIAKKLGELGATVEVYDPFITEASTLSSLEECLQCDALLLVTEHTEFKGLDYDKLAGSKVKVVVDGRNALDGIKIREAGIIYKGIGVELG